MIRNRRPVVKNSGMSPDSAMVHKNPAMVHNSAMPKITVCPETFEVTADGAPLVCEPATKVPLARKFFLF